jgi:hypothetical protein
VLCMKYKELIQLKSADQKLRHRKVLRTLLFSLSDEDCNPF